MFIVQVSPELIAPMVKINLWTNVDKLFSLFNKLNLNMDKAYSKQKNLEQIFIIKKKKFKNKLFLKK